MRICKKIDMGRSIKRDFQYLSVTTIIVAMALLSGFWIFYDYKMLKLESVRLRTKHMAEYETLLRDEVNRVVTNINYEKSLTEQRLNNYLLERTNEAYSIATSLLNRNAGNLDNITLQKLIRDSLRNIRFQNGRGYYFAFNVHGTIELLPTEPSLEGRNLYAEHPILRQFVIEDALQAVAASGEGFYSYAWSKPNNSGHNHPKLAYLKYIPELDWIIGTGEYLDDFTLDLQRELCAKIEKIRFGKEKKEYVFVGTWDGVSLTFPAKGRNMLQTKDANGLYIVKEFIEKAKNGGGFVQYVMPTLNTVHSAPKLSYTEPIPDWQWYIGAGVYIDEIDTLIANNQQLFKDKVFEHLKIMALVLLCLLLINYFTASFISRSIWKQIHLFSQFFHRASTESISMESEHLVYREFREIGNQANIMLEQRNTFLHEIRLSRDEWINTFNAIGDCILLLDAKGYIINANTKAVKLLKMASDEIISQHFSSICSNINLINLTLTDQLPHSAEIYNKELNKEFIGSSFPIFTAEGQLHRVIFIARDITEQKKLKEKLAQSQKMEAIGLLAGGVAHDLNNILSGIVSYPDIILTQLPEGSTLKKQILAIQRSGQQAAEIVADLLTLARGTAANKKIINLNTLILEYLESPENRKVRNMHPLVSISTHFDTALFCCNCSPVHIKKSLMNLIINAAEAINGSGHIILSTHNLCLRPEKAQELHIESGEYVVLKVADNGTGIPEPDLKRIFEPFYTKKVMGNSGSGLGLSVVWNSIKDHQGAVDVVSSLEGTTFTIYLPATDEQMSEDEQNSDLRDLKGNGETILIIDDDEQQRDIAILITKKLAQLCD